jgi:hypothetical protein
MTKQIKSGRPAWVPDKSILRKAERCATHGLTESQIADNLGICRATLAKKKIEYSDFLDAIKKGKAKGIHEIANTLFEKAKKGDTTAMIFYLKCRAGWFDKKEDEPNLYNRPVRELSDDELNQILLDCQEGLKNAGK